MNEVDARGHRQPRKLPKDHSLGRDATRAGGKESDTETGGDEPEYRRAITGLVPDFRSEPEALAELDRKSVV